MNGMSMDQDKIYTIRNGKRENTTCNGLLDNYFEFKQLLNAVFLTHDYSPVAWPDSLHSQASQRKRLPIGVTRMVSLYLKAKPGYVLQIQFSYMLFITG